MATKFLEGFTLDTLLGVVAILLALVGLYVAINESKAVHQTRKALEDARSGLERAVADVRSEISTRYVGPFPDFMSAIVASLEQATTSIKIFCDQPAYGIVSNPDMYRAYVDLLRAKHEDGVSIEMVHLNKTRRDESSRVQFCGPRWEATRADERLAAFVAERSDAADGKALDAMSEDDLVAFLDNVQRHALDQDFAFLKKYPSGQIMPLYFWIPDPGPAVFALTRFDSDNHEEGFSTESRALIDSMCSIFERYRKVVQGIPVAPPPAGAVRLD